MGRPISAACTTQGASAFSVYVWCAVGAERLLGLRRSSSDRPAQAPVGLPRGDSGGHGSSREEQSRSRGVVATEHTTLVAAKALLRVPGRCWPRRVWTWGLKPTP